MNVDVRMVLVWGTSRITPRLFRIAGVLMRLYFVFPPLCLCCPSSLCASLQPLPIRGWRVGITVMSRTFAPAGRLTMCSTDAATSSAATKPSLSSLRATSSGDLFGFWSVKGHQKFC